ncbi:MAG: RNA-binding protein [Bryobacteraceae bacterium]|jgi:RNA recognition motif-containing protein
MSYTVFLGNLPVWVTADDIRSWLSAESLVADSIKVIRNPETQESKGFAFIDAPNSEEMQSIIRRFDRAPLEDRLLRANPAQPPRQKGQPPPGLRSAIAPPNPTVTTGVPAAAAAGPVAAFERPRRERGGRKHKRPNQAQGGHSAFAEELAKAL